ncbi:hypothetical protein C2S52_002510 [Perilla frutescens var. hirtella]|nr:hypothetical protein C2S52_002510 [Perilla frutescens var. hirtella]
MVSLRRKRAAAAAAAAAEAEAARRVHIEHDEMLEPIQKLRQIQEELQEVNKEANMEILKTKKRYIDKKKSMYSRRNQIIGDIPCFWLIAFMNNIILQNLLKEDDQEIFCYLDSVVVEDFADPRKGYYIAFNFMDNPFFSNKILSRTINFLVDGTLRSVGTTIEWKAGKGSAYAGNSERRPSAAVESFFSWFCSPEEDKEAEVEKDLVAKIFKEEIWPNPIDGLLSIDEHEDDDEGGDSDGNS